jgi:hypothetical protein
VFSNPFFHPWPNFSHIPIDKVPDDPIVPMIPIPSDSFHQKTTKEEEDKRRGRRKRNMPADDDDAAVETDHKRM